MEKIYRRAKTNIYVAHQDIITFFLGVFGFFLGRVVVFQTISPLAIAFLCIFCFRGARFYVTMLFVALGLFTKSSEIYFLKYVMCMGFVMVSHYIFGKNKLLSKGENILSQALIGGFSILVAGLIVSALNHFSLFYALLALLEGVMTFSLAYVLKKSITVFDVKAKKKMITNEDLLSLGILAGGILAGAADVYIGSISLMYLFLTVVILVVAYKASATVAAVSGLLFGFCLLLAGFCNTEFVVILSMAGLVAGSFHTMGKFYLTAGFALGGVIVAFYMDKSILTMELLFSVILGSILFLLVPRNLYLYATNTLNSGIDNTDAYMFRVKEVTTDKLLGFSRAFKKLSGTFSNLSYKKKGLDQKDVAKLIDDVASRICSNCNMKVYCWENNFYNTYQTVFSILAACEKKGYIELSDIPNDFKDTCIDVVNFADVTNRLFEFYKTNLMWHNKIVDSRELVAKQLTGVSDIIENIAKELTIELEFKEDFEKKIADELLKNKIETDSVIVLKNREGRYEVSIKHSACYGKRCCTKEIAPIVSKILSKKMNRNYFECNIVKEGAKSVCKLKLIEEQQFRISTGKASAPKTDSNVSGDSYTMLEIDNGQFLVALSDGMGSGSGARQQSTTAIELFEDFIQTGFEKDMAINMINSVLVLKSNEENFSTLDICTIDLYTGLCEFVKIGAASTFIVHNNKVEMIKSSSLPVGILNTVDVEVNRKKLNESDMIIMMTDGVMDSKEEYVQKELWIMEALQEFECNNPQDMADYILNEAKKNSAPVVKDDMTVLVTRLWN